MSKVMVYWAIVELHNGLFDTVRAPYNSQDEAMDHVDKLRAYRQNMPNGISYEYRVVRVLHPSYVG